MISQTEDELDILVSVAIRRAELLDDTNSPAAADAWREVMTYEERLAAITNPSDLAGGIARTGAVRAALAAGHRVEAARLASQYLAEALLPAERRNAIKQALQQFDATTQKTRALKPAARIWTNGATPHPSSSRKPHVNANRP